MSKTIVLSDATFEELKLVLNGVFVPPVIVPPIIDPPVIPPVVQPPVIPPGTNILLLDWNEASTWRSREHGGFSCNQQICWQISVPATANNNETKAFNVSEYGGLPTIRQLTLSETPFDFRFPGPNGSIMWSNGTSVGIYLTVGFNVKPGKTYYLSVRNWSIDLNSTGCTEGSRVDIIASLTKS